MKLFYIVAATLVSASLFAVEMKDSKNIKTISNKYYSLTLDNVKGALKTLAVGKKKYIIYGSQEFRKNGEQKKYNGQQASSGFLYNGNNSKQKVSVISKSADKIEICCELDKGFTKSKIYYTFDNTPIIKCRMTADFTEAPSDWFYTLRLMNFSVEKNAFILPEKNAPSVPFDWSFYVPGNNWKFAYRRQDGVFVVPVGCLKN